MIERLWRMLPDRCQCIGCSRQGVRGNEIRCGGRLVCDYCYSRQGHLYFGTWLDRQLYRLPEPWRGAARSAIFAALLIYIFGGAVAFAVAMWR